MISGVLYIHFRSTPHLIKLVPFSIQTEHKLILLFRWNRNINAPVGILVIIDRKRSKTEPGWYQIQLCVYQRFPSLNQSIRRISVRWTLLFIYLYITNQFLQNSLESPNNALLDPISILAY